MHLQQILLKLHIFTKFDMLHDLQKYEGGFIVFLQWKIW